MRNLFRTTSHKKGLPPGSLIHVGEESTEKVKIVLLDYTHERFEEKQLQTIEESLPYIQESSVTWINIIGVHDRNVIESVGKFFEINSLTLEDVMNTNQRPKVENYEHYLYVVLRTVFYGQTSKEMNFENVSIILGKNFVISFQEKENQLFNSIRERVIKASGRIRKRENDFLAYALMDTIVDHYFPTLEYLGDKIEECEEQLMENPDEKILHQLHIMRREILLFSKSVHPVREIVGFIQREDTELVNDETLNYIRDVYDHVIHVIETLDAYRDIVTGLVEMYLSTVSNRMNQVMKVLSIIATIFIPLTFITGIYGMNFAHMPELNVPEAYYVVLGIMISVAVTMIIYFWRKGWF